MKIYGVEIHYTPPTYAPDLRTEWLRAEYRDCKAVTKLKADVKSV